MCQFFNGEPSYLSIPCIMYKFSFFISSFIGFSFEVTIRPKEVLGLEPAISKQTYRFFFHQIECVLKKVIKILQFRWGWFICAEGHVESKYFRAFP